MSNANDTQQELLHQMAEKLQASTIYLETYIVTNEANRDLKHFNDKAGTNELIRRALDQLNRTQEAFHRLRKSYGVMGLNAREHEMPKAYPNFSTRRVHFRPPRDTEGTWLAK